MSTYYSESQSLSPSSKYSVYAIIPITIGIDQLSEVVEEVAGAGFSIESVYASYGYYPEYYEGIPVEFVEPGFDDGESFIAEEMSNETLVIEPEFLVNLNIVIDTELHTLQNAVSEYQTKFESLTSLLQNVVVLFDQIHPAEISINPDYYSTGADTSLYESYVQLIVKANIEDVESIVAAGQQQGAYVENIFLSVPDNQIDELRRDLGQLAIENARSRANEIAEPLGMQSATIRSIEINTNSYDYQYGSVAIYRGVNLVSAYDNAGAYGINEVSVSATVEFELQ